MSENQQQNESMAAPRIYVERTLALIKPDVLHKAEEIEDIIQRSGFFIIQLEGPSIAFKVAHLLQSKEGPPQIRTAFRFARMVKFESQCAKKRKVHLSPEQCSDFYSEQYGKMFFPSLTAYMSSGAIIALELAKHNAIISWRQLMGPSNSLEAKETHPNSLRAIYGTDDLRNAVHGSYCVNSAEREIRFMFPNGTIEPVPAGEAAKDYLNLFVNPTLLAALTELCKQKPADPYIWLADWLLQHNPNRPDVHNGPIVEE